MFAFRLLAFLLLLAGPVMATAPVAPLDLVAAQGQQKIQIQASAAGLAGDNLRCQVTNLTDRELTVRVPPGLYFVAATADLQDLLTYRQQLLTLAPGAVGTLQLKGFCTEQHDRAPTAAAYTLRGFAGQGLRPLADSLQKYPQLADAYGQYFVWALTDNMDVGDIDVLASQVRGATNVLRYIGGVTGRPVGKAVASANATPSVHPFMQNVTVRYRSLHPQTVSLKVFGANGNERYTIVRSQRIGAGPVEFAFGLNVMLKRNEEPVFTVRLLSAAGAVLHEVRVSETSTAPEAAPTSTPFDFAFALDQPLKNARLRVRLSDGTLVEELKQMAYLPAGEHRYRWAFQHRYPAGTAFVVRLETAAGKVVRQLALAPTTP